MRPFTLRRFGLATGIALVLAVAFLGILAAAPASPDGISFDLAPVPPRSIIPGVAETFTWTITGGTPDHVDFEIRNPAGAVVDSHTYPGGTGLAVTRQYTPAVGAQLGLYWSEVRYFPLEGGMLKAGGAFCVSERGNLHVYKFDDFNGNGRQDADEGPVAGVLIRMSPQPGSLCPSDPSGQLTGTDGWARWNDIAVGTYVVTETVPSGREPTLPISHTVDIHIGATRVITFANRLPPSRIEGLVWHDKDADSGVDPDETGLPNITVRLYEDRDGDGIIDGTDSQIGQTDTDAGGRYLFPLVRSGDYVVVVDQADPDLPLGLVPLGSVAVAVSHLAPGASASVNFGFDDSGRLVGHVWHDSDGDGMPDIGEVDLAGIQVCLFGDTDGDGQLDGSDPLLGCLNSNAAGNASFTGLAAGKYLLEAHESDPDLPAGYKLTTTNPQGYDLPPGVSQVLHFGFRLPPTPTPTPTATPTATPVPANGCIIGRKVDVLQVGLSGWTIHARPRGAEQPMLTAVTDGSGDFLFVGLQEGTWTVWEEMQPGWTAVTPAQLDVVVPGSPPCVAVSFKNRRACAIDPYEPDNSFASAAPLLPNGAGQSHTLEPLTDQDWVRFNTVAGAIYTLQTDNLVGSTDTFLTLYDTDGITLLAANDDIATGSDPRSRIVWTAPNSGTYFARVRDYYQDGARDCLGYDLVLKAEFRNYLPLLLAPPPPPPAATPTPTPTDAPTATPTRTPVPTLPPIAIQGLSHPKGIGVNLRTHRLFVASRDTDVVYEVNPLTGSVIRSIPVGQEPFGVAVNSTTNKVYVANFVSNDVSVINGATGTVIKTIPLAPYGEPTNVAINETTNRIYVALHRDGRVAVINGATDALSTTIEVGQGAFDVAVDPLLSRVYVSCRDIKTVQVIDSTTNTVLWDQTIYPVGMPYALGINAGLKRLYVSFSPEIDDPRQVLVYQISATGPSLLTAVLVGHGGPDGGGGIGVNPATNHVFVSNSAEDSVSVFDGMTNMLLDTVPVGDDPMDVAVDPGLNYAFVGNRASNTVSGIPDGY